MVYDPKKSSPVIYAVYPYDLKDISAKDSLKNQNIKINKSSVTYKKTVLKKKKQTFKIEASAKGRITYKKISGDKRLTIGRKSGKVTIKKGSYEKKAYKLKVKITAASTSEYKKATKTFTIKIKVR